MYRVVLTIYKNKNKSLQLNLICNAQFTVWNYVLYVIVHEMLSLNPQDKSVKHLFVPQQLYLTVF